MGWQERSYLSDITGLEVELVEDMVVKGDLLLMEMDEHRYS